MSNQERSNFISLITTLVTSVPYYIYIMAKFQSENLTGNDLISFWTSAILWLIPLRIVAEIVFHIAFSIGRVIITKKDDDTMLTDERDNLIELKGTRNSSYVFMISVLFAMIGLSIDKSISTMFIIFIIGGFLSEIVGILSQIYYYRKS